MRVLLVGVGTVGEAIARIARGRPWLERMVLADYSLDRARRVQADLGDDRTFPAVKVDAGNRRELVELARAHRVDVIMNAVDPSFVMPIFDAALESGSDYIDMAMSLSEPDRDDPYRRPGVKLGDAQFAHAAEWEQRGRLALVGMGMDPGLSDVFARYAAKHLFDEIDAVHVRDGGDLRVEGLRFAPVFSIWTTIEECLNPPVIWDRDRGWYTTEPFSEPEEFFFPDAIGPVECVNVEHEEVLLVPRWIDCRNVTFKYALGTEFIAVLRTLNQLGLDRKDPIRVKGVQVAPRDVVAALTPDPATLGNRMVGRAVVGTWVIGREHGRPRAVYLYQLTDARETMERWKLQPVAWQTGFNPVIAMELLAGGEWSGAGVLGPEAFDPDPYLALLKRYGIHHATVEMDPLGAPRPA